MERRKISIATGCYKSEAFIERTFNSIVAQQYENLEWSVVVDGKLDGTLDVLERCKARASFPVKIIVFEKNRGSGVAVPTAVANCTGEFTCILDHDDELLPGALLALLNVWDEVTAAEDPSTLYGVFGRCIDENDRFIGRRTGPKPIVSTLAYYLHVTKCGAECASIFRTDLLHAYYRLTPEELGCPNGLIWNRLDRRFKAIFTDLVVRRYHTNTPGSQSSVKRIQAPRALANQELEYLNDNAVFFRVDPLTFVRRIAMYERCVFHARMGMVDGIRALRSRRIKAVAVFLLPVALAAALRDKRLARVG